MSTDVLIHTRDGNVDVQPGGPGNNWKYLSPGAMMSGPSVPLGGIERRWEQDPDRATKFRTSSQFRTAPDFVGFDITTKLGKMDYLAQLMNGFGARSRMAKGSSGSRSDTKNYDPIMLCYAPL